MSSLNERLIEVLRSRRLVSQEQLDEALAEQRRQGGSLQAILAARGWVSEADLFSALSQELGIPPVNVGRLTVDPTLKRLIPREIALHYQVLPISCLGRTLTVAMADPLNVLALDALTALTSFSVKPCLASPQDLREAIERYYGSGVEETLQEMARQTESSVASFTQHAGDEEADVARLLSLTQEAPVVKYTDALLERAVRLRASDILIEPMEHRVRIRYRVDGVLQEGPAPPQPLHTAVVSRLKVMSELNIAERRLPQDGHFQVHLNDRPIDYRISTLPSMFGEKVALRLLDKGTVTLDVGRLGFAPEDLERLKVCARRPHGMILVTGPTGSGKTTTLYAVLKLVDAATKNLVTVEDPVEFDLDGINQVTARPEIGLTFAGALRAILRQDPDVIMVGEIRDPDTADMAVKAALTGHLVLSTLHTNTAAGTIVRLVNMGIEPFLINACLIAVVGQRLVRKVCPRCPEPYHPPQGLAEQLGLLDRARRPLPLARGRGCEACLQSGYAGREVIAEVLVVTPKIRELILAGAQERQIESAARAAGMKRMRDHGLQKAVAGVTTIEEVFRTTTGEVTD